MAATTILRGRAWRRARRRVLRSACGRSVPKLCGADMELGHFIQGDPRPGGSCAEAGLSLLRAIPGVPHRGGVGVTPYVVPTSTSGRSESSAQDWGRKFLPGCGGCAYLDLGHLELCTPEVRSAWDHLAYAQALLRLARQAQLAVDADLPTGQHVFVCAANSDGQGNAYGSHLNFLITRRTLEDLLHRRLQDLLWLAAYQASSIVFTGQGKVGSENAQPPAEYQLAARADFFETLVGWQTTFNRPLVNARDEALCGSQIASQAPAAGLARLHVIFYDQTLCHVASVLKVGVLQIVLALLEARGADWRLLLDDPLAALLAWSRDPTLNARARLADGGWLTAVELQERFLERAAAFVERGGCDRLVPRAREIVTLWADTLALLRAAAAARGSPETLAPLAGRIDWVLKLHLLRTTLQRHPHLDWGAPELAHLDRLYASLDPADGLYWACERAGLTQRLVSEAQVERCLHEPPPDTRAWTRAMLLRRAGAERITSIDWDRIEFRVYGPDGWPRRHTLHLDDPRAHTRGQVEHHLRRARSLAALLDALDPADSLPAVSARSC